MDRRIVCEQNRSKATKIMGGDEIKGKIERRF